MSKLHFNTSNVTIQHIVNFVLGTIESDFNTSNVTIQRNIINPNYTHSRISIHLMLLFNDIVNAIKGAMRNFNTSNVTIQLRR